MMIPTEDVAPTRGSQKDISIPKTRGPKTPGERNPWGEKPPGRRGKRKPIKGTTGGGGITNLGGLQYL